MTADLHPDSRAPRPGTCCGVCPPIAGGGWDCTCAGLPGCPATANDARAEAERRYNSAVLHSDLTYPAHALESHRRAAFVAGAKWAAGRAETTTGAIARGEALSAGDLDWSNVTRRAETTTATTEDAARVLYESGTGFKLTKGKPWEELSESSRDSQRRLAQALADAGLLATARTRPTRTIYSVQHWEDADGIRASWVTGYGQYTHSREDAEATLRHQERQHPDTTFRLAQAEVTAWTEADR